MSEEVAIVWFRNDLRLLDNPALYHAYKNYNRVIPIYIFDENLGGNWKRGEASKWWLHHALFHLNRDLNKEGCTLIIKKGETLEQLRKILSFTKAKEIFFNSLYELFNIKLEQEVEKLCSLLGAKVTRFKGNLLLEPWGIKNKQGNNFNAFTPYWNACKKKVNLPSSLPKPEFKVYHIQLSSDSLDDLNLLPKKVDWAGGLRDTWEASEKRALQLFETFIDNRLGDYSELRERPDIIGTSFLSPYLHFGQISVEYIYNSLRFLSCRNQTLSQEIEKYLSEIGWREFSYYLLYNFPRLPEENFKSYFDKFPWNTDKKLLKAWQKGLTGYPIVDAGMRQLRSIGWMHNRVRMIVASFLTKNLLISWREGAKWFWDNLVDADLANNSANWQWVSGSGADAAPYFRIFNPVLQGEKFDPKGEYVRKWVLELALLPNMNIHKPWENFSSKGFKIGMTYPQPIVNYNISRAHALAIYKQIKT